MVLNPGVYNLASKQITAPISSETQTVIDNLDGMTALSLEANFAYGSGGASLIAVVQTTLDGINYRDIARFDFATATAVKIANLEGLLSKGITAYSPLVAEGVNDGFLGNALRALVSVTGTYVNSTLTINGSVR